MPQTSTGQSRTSGGTFKTLKRSTDEWMKIFGRSDITLTTRTITQNANGRTLSTVSSSSTVTGDLQYSKKAMKEYVDLGVALTGDGIVFFPSSVSISLSTDLVEYYITVDSVEWRLVEQVEGEVVDLQVPYTGFIVRRKP